MEDHSGTPELRRHHCSGEILSARCDYPNRMLVAIARLMGRFAGLGIDRCADEEHRQDRHSAGRIHRVMKAQRRLGPDLNDD